VGRHRQRRPAAAAPAESASEGAGTAPGEREALLAWLATVHTYDAQITLGAPLPLPGQAALDGVEEFLSTCCAWTAPWPHEAAAVDFHATEGRSWRLTLSADGARTARLPTPGTISAAGAGPDVAFASAWGTAAELVLVFYDRIPIESLQLDGDLRLFGRLREWDPD
jgi:hypothetical protein